jgi:hydrogenase maturation protease
VRAVDYGIRGMHLAYDLLDGYDALVIVDALPGDGPVGTVRVFDPHGMAPVAVLASLGDLGGRLPPTYVVGVRPRDVDERIGLSDEVEAAVPEAMDAVHVLLRERIRVPAATPNGAD